MTAAPASAPAPAVCWSCRSEITDGRCECMEPVSTGMRGLALTALLIVAEIAAFVLLGMALVWGWPGGR